MSLREHLHPFQKCINDVRSNSKNNQHIPYLKILPKHAEAILHALTTYDPFVEPLVEQLVEQLDVS